VRKALGKGAKRVGLGQLRQNLEGKGGIGLSQRGGASYLAAWDGGRAKGVSFLSQSTEKRKSAPRAFGGGKGDGNRDWRGGGEAPVVASRRMVRGEIYKERG